MDFSDDLQIHDLSSDLCHRFMSYSAFHVCTLCGLAPPSQRMPSISPFSEANFLRILVLVTNTRTAILCQLYDLEGVGTRACGHWFVTARVLPRDNVDRLTVTVDNVQEPTRTVTVVSSARHLAVVVDT